MGQSLLNILALSYKEVKSLIKDLPLVVLIGVIFTFVVYTVHQQVRSEVKNASIAVVDEDASTLSQAMVGDLIPPYFKEPKTIALSQVQKGLDQGNYIFVLHFPSGFQGKVANHQDSKIQLWVDATSMTQAGIGTAYIGRIFTQELLHFYHLDSLDNLLPNQENSKIYFNQNNDSGRYSSVMQLVMNTTLLSLILMGAAVIREKEHGTIEHLLVMPVGIIEIAIAKIVANGGVILLTVLAALYGVVQGLLAIPIHGSFFLILLSCAAYIFAATSLGMLLATLAPSMPQFGLIATPIIMISHLTSGSASPVEAMAPKVQSVVNFSPTTHFVYNIQDLVFRGAHFHAIAFSLFVLIIYGMIFFIFALLRFRTMLQRFN